MADDQQINSVTNPPQTSLEERLAQIPAEAWDPSLRGPLTPEEVAEARARAALPAPAPQPAAPSGLSSEASLLLTQFKAVDPNRAGVGLDKIRMFYPRVGWDVILARVKELEDANVLSHKPVMNQRGSVGYNLYTWAEA